MMSVVEVPLSVQDTSGVDRKGWCVSSGIPFADGAVQSDQIRQGQYRLLDPQDRPVPCQCRIAAEWGNYPHGSNGSVKWLHIHFPADVPAGETSKYRFCVGPDLQNPSSSEMRVVEEGDRIIVQTGQGRGALRVVFSRREFNILEEVSLDLDGEGFQPADRILSPRPTPNLWMTYDHRKGRINANRPVVTVEQSGPVLAVIRASVKLDDRFESIVRVYLYAGSSHLRIQETLVHGPTGQDRSAIRSQPVVMKGHVLEFCPDLQDGTLRATVGVGEQLPEPARWEHLSADLQGGQRLVLEQDLRHECREGNVGDDLLSQAFHYDVFHGSERLEQGQRAPGWIDLSSSNGRGITAAVREFWQSFPKRISAGEDGIRFEHWAVGAQLEPLSRNFHWTGMARTHDVGVLFHGPDADADTSEQFARAFAHPLHAACEPEYYCQSQAYGRHVLTPAVQDGKQAWPDHDHFLSAALNRERTIPDGLYYFREREDDYGYSHFGDFLVVSYWGCQEYDPAYCMLQQYYRCGELKYLDFARETARCLYDVLYSHHYTPETSNYPQREHDKSGSHFEGEDSHGQESTNIDCGHVFLAGLTNYWYLTADPRAEEVIRWSLPIYLADDWYRIGGGGTWRYLGGYLLAVMTYAYELTWDDRYVELMLWAAKQYMVHGRTRHEDGIWWDWKPKDEKYICQPWLADSITNGYTHLLEVYPGCPYRKQIEQAVVNLADFIIDQGIVDDGEGIVAHMSKSKRDSHDYTWTNAYRKSMAGMVLLTLAKAYAFTGDAQRYLEAVRKLRCHVVSQAGQLEKLKPVAQGSYYLSMILPYLEGAVETTPQPPVVEEPRNNWQDHYRQLHSRVQPDAEDVMYLGDELASLCAPPERRGRFWGNAPGWRITDVLGALEHLLKRGGRKYWLVLIGASDLPTGHPERTDFEANVTLLVRQILRAEGIPILSTLPACTHLQPWLWQYNAVITQAARLHRLPLIELAGDETGDLPPERETLELHSKTPPADWVHANRFVEGFERSLAGQLEAILAVR